jgi:hypothetical protein
MVECEGLVLVTLSKMEKKPKQFRGASEGCDSHEEEDIAELKRQKANE